VVSFFCPLDRVPKIIYRCNPLRQNSLRFFNISPTPLFIIFY
jgi:hypothetical protein